MSNGLSSLSLLIKNSINRIVLTTDNTLDEFVTVFNDFNSKTDRNAFLDELSRRFEKNVLNDFISDCTFVSIGENDWHHHYIYGEIDHPNDWQLLYKEDHPLYQNDFEMTAFENWKRRKQEELDLIVKYLQGLGYHFDVPIHIPLKIEGLRTTLAKEQLVRLHDELTEGFIDKSVSIEVFSKCLTQQEMDRYPLIQWKRKNNLFYYLLTLLEERIAKNEPYVAKICQDRLFIGEDGQPFNYDSMRSNISKVRNGKFVEESNLIDNLYERVFE